jgi:hypothetical protein
MCGRVRLSNDYSEIKIRLRFDAEAPAPNLAPSWNMPPTGDMLVATYSAEPAWGKRYARAMVLPVRRQQGRNREQCLSALGGGRAWQ